MASDDQKKRFSYQKLEFLAILDNDYTQTLVKQIAEDPNYEFLRNFNKSGLKRYLNKKPTDDAKATGLVLCPEKRSWNTGCHAESNSNTKTSPNNSSNLNFIRGVNANQCPNQQRSNNRFSRGGDQNQYNEQNKTRSIIGPNGRGQAEFRRNGPPNNHASNGGFNRSRGGSNVGGLFTRNNYNPKNNKNDRTYDFDNLPNDEEEPEWFSEGPTSFQDTIELGRVIDGEDFESDSDSHESNKTDSKSQNSDKLTQKENKGSEVNFKSESSDQGASRLLKLIAPSKPSEPVVDNRKQVENKLRSLIIRPDQGFVSNSQNEPKALSVEELEAKEFGGKPNEIKECINADQTVSPLKHFLNSLNQQGLNKSALANNSRSKANPGASKLFSMITEVAQQNAKEHGATRSSSFDSEENGSPTATGSVSHENEASSLPSVPFKCGPPHMEYPSDNNIGTNNIIDSLLETSHMKSNMIQHKEEPYSSSNLSAILSRFGQASNVAAAATPNMSSSSAIQMQHHQQQMLGQNMNQQAPPPGFGFTHNQPINKPSSSILSALNVTSSGGPPGFTSSVSSQATGDGIGSGIMFGGMKFSHQQQVYPKQMMTAHQQMQQQSQQPQQKPTPSEQNMAIARLLHQVQQQKMGSGSVGPARAIVKQQPRSDGQQPQSFNNSFPVSQKSAFQPTQQSPGFTSASQQHQQQQQLNSLYGRLLMGGGAHAQTSSSSSRGPFIPNQVQQQLAAKARAMNEQSSSILPCRMHFEQFKTTGAADQIGCGRPITSEKTMPAGHNHH